MTLSKDGGVSGVGIERAYHRSVLARFHQTPAGLGQTDGIAVFNNYPPSRDCKLDCVRGLPVDLGRLRQCSGWPSVASYRTDNMRRAIVSVSLAIPKVWQTDRRGARPSDSASSSVNRRSVTLQLWSGVRHSSDAGRPLQPTGRPRCLAHTPQMPARRGYGRVRQRSSLPRLASIMESAPAAVAR